MMSTFVRLSIVGRDGLPGGPKHPMGVTVNAANVICVEDAPIFAEKHPNALNTHVVRMIDGSEYYVRREEDLRVLRLRLEGNPLCRACGGSGDQRTEDNPPGNECCDRCGGSGAEPDDDVGFVMRALDELDRLERVQADIEETESEPSETTADQIEVLERVLFQREG